MQATFGILFLCITAAYGLLFGSNSGSAWSSLQTTWGPNPFSSDYFVKQPLTVEEAKKGGFEQIPGACEGKFLGQRFIKSKDVGLILIYDSQGIIAGAQMAIPASMITDKYYNFTTQKMYNRDTIGGIDVYILTAYFIDPKTICHSDRDINGFKKGDIGSGVWFQNGTDPVRDSVSSPADQSEASTTKWVQGSCFPTMGIHYWYDNRLDSDCDTYFPAFLMYNKGKLTGFGWVAFGKYEYTKRTEFPPLAAITSFLKPVPTCIPQRYNDAGGFTTMHVYFNAEAWNLLC